MRFLIAISILQAILLAIVAFRLNDVDARTDAIEAAVRNHTAAPAIVQDTGAAPVITGPSAAQIRSIIREELAANNHAPAVAAGEEAPSQQPSGAIVRSPDEIAQLRLDVQQDLSFYRGQGAINDAQMAQIQLKIAKLPADERRAALTELTKLINSKNFDARL